MADKSHDPGNVEGGPLEPNGDQPRSLYPESETPLADIDPLLPTLSLFQSLTLGRFMREKAAVLRQLALAERGIWTYGELDAILWWIPATFKRYIVDQMRGSLILYDELARTYSLNPEARVLCTLLTAVGGKDRKSPKVFVAHLLKIQDLADAGTNGTRRWDVLRTAVAWLQSRQLELENSLRQGLVDPALQKAREMDSVLDQIREFLAAQDAVLRTSDGQVPPEVLNFLRDGHRAVAEVLNLIHFVYRTLAQASNEFLTGQRNFTVQDVRSYVTQTSRDEIINLLRGALSSIPWSCAESAETIFPGAITYFSTERGSAPPLPEITAIEVHIKNTIREDPISETADSIFAAVQQSGSIKVSNLVVRSDWSTSLAASRLLPEADALLVERELLGGDRAPELYTDGKLEEVRRGGVAAITDADFRRSTERFMPRRSIVDVAVPKLASGASNT